jgi:hypothetical protein
MTCCAEQIGAQAQRNAPSNAVKIGFDIRVIYVT